MNLKALEFEQLKMESLHVQARWGVIMSWTWRLLFVWGNQR